MWKRIVRQFFEHNYEQKRAILIFLFLNGLIIAGSQLYQKYTRNKTLNYDPTQLHELCEKLNASSDENQANAIERKEAPTYHFFNPNQLSWDEAQALGIKKSAYNNLQKYLETGAKIRTADEFSRIYGISEELVRELKPWIQIPEDKQKIVKSKSKIERKPVHFHFNPNDLTENEAKDLGINGAVYSNLKKYLSTGAAIETPEDFSRIYGLSESDYLRLKPWMVFPERKTKEAHKIKGPGKKEETITYFDFDPNTLDETSAKRLGIPFKVFRNLEKYREAGALFTEPSDLQKIYGLSDSLFNSLRPFIVIETPKMITNERTELSEPLNINLASSKDFENMGLNSSISRRIVKYREKLGGFATLSQLSEVFKISAIDLEKINNSSKLETSETRKLNINTATQDELMAHPYISYKVAQAILQMRENFDGFSSIGQITASYLIDEKQYKKLEPYLTL